MREDVLGRHRQLREIITRHYERALDHAAAPALLDGARRLGLDVDRLLLADDVGEFDARLRSRHLHGKRAAIACD